jgi:bifunctional non-homologous end joining protein LigD
LPAHERIDALQLAPSGPAEELPSKLSPMLACPGERPFTDSQWVFEPKLDGYRVLACIDGKSVDLRSRRGLDLTRAFPSVVAELAEQAVSGMVLDGEIVAIGADGKLSFNALQNRVQLKTDREIASADRDSPVIFYAFDILHFAGTNLRRAPYAARRRWLAQCLLPHRHVRLVDVHDDGVALYDAALAHGFEGVMAKRLDSPYEPGRRSLQWLKIKATKSGEFVIGGYTQGKGSRAPLGSLLVGYWDKEELHYAAHVGSGFDERALKDVKRRLEPLQTPRTPFVERPDLHSPTTWVRPDLVAEVNFQDWTPDGSLRAPIFVRLREDVDARSIGKPLTAETNLAAAPEPAQSEDVQIEAVLQQLDNDKPTLQLQIGEHRVKLTNLDRVYWPEDRAVKQPQLTKRALLRYLARASPFMLTHLADRPLTMIRFPEGIHGERFFQKHWEQSKPPPFVEKVRVFSESKSKQDEYLLCSNLPTLLWLAQAGTLEFHVWHSRACAGPDAVTQSTDFSSSLEAMDNSVLNYPDYLIFDIDPYIYSGKEPKGAEPELNTAAFEKGKEVAFHLKELLNGMSLEPIVKTSGKTGLHVFVPIERTQDFDAVRQMCEAVGRHLVQRYPKDITMEWSVNKRTGKIFMDYGMNVRGKTLNVAYSPRALPGAAVSMPLTWKELEKAHPLDFRLTNALEKLQKRGDVWQDALLEKQNLERALARDPK